MLWQCDQGIDLKERPSTTNTISIFTMKTWVVSRFLHMRMFPQGPAVLFLLAGTSLAVTPETEASAYRCFDRQTGEQVAISDIDITTPSVSCLPNDGTTTAPDGNGDSDPDDDDFNPGLVPEANDEDEDDEDDTDTTPSTPAPSSTTLDPLAIQRALNLARGTAVSLNGGLSQYRPGACMFASINNNPCITRADSEGIEFTVPGGPPGWEQNGDGPSMITVVVISADGRSVLETRNN